GMLRALYVLLGFGVAAAAGGGAASGHGTAFLAGGFRGRDRGADRRIFATTPRAAMNGVEVTRQPELAGKCRALVLTEDRVGHYPEFREFFRRTFDLDRRGLAEPGYVTRPSGLTYALVFIGSSGEPFPAGVEIHALVP